MLTKGHEVHEAGRKRAIGLLAALCVLAGNGLVGALPSGTAGTAGLVMTPLRGTGTTPFAVQLTAPDDACPGDTQTGGYRWSTFVASASLDAATFTYDASGPVRPPDAPADAIVRPLSNTAGVALVDLETVVGTGQVGPIPDALLDPIAGASPGRYHVGLACSLGGVTERFWQTTITIDGVIADTFDWVRGTAPDPPTIDGPLTSADGALRGSFTMRASDPPATGYSVTAVARSGGQVVTAPVAAPGAFSVEGLTNGVAYDVSITATNDVGASGASNVVGGVPAIPPRPAVTGLTVDPGVQSAVVRWTAPAGFAPLDYLIDVVPPVDGAPFVAASGSSSYLVDGLTATTAYVFTVTPRHPPPFVAEAAASTPVTAFAPFGVSAATPVVVGVGGLVLTQRCGVYGELPEEAEAVSFPAVPAVAASTDTVGIAPTDAEGRPDQAFAEYPYPVAPTYPTRCAIDMGAARLLTQGPMAGQYFAATGRLNQVSIVDTRDLDIGFTVAGRVSSFSSGTNAFSAAYVGWTPIVSDDSDPTPDGYDQLVVAGEVVPPGTVGLSSTKPLAMAPAGRSIGTAVVDARIKLLIPVTADAGAYRATLTITAI